MATPTFPNEVFARLGRGTPHDYTAEPAQQPPHLHPSITWLPTLRLLLPIFLHSAIHLLPLLPSFSSSSSGHLSSGNRTFRQLHPVWSPDRWGGWGTPVTSDDSPSLPAVAFNQWKSYFGDEQRGSCFFHELLYNRITQPESPVAPSLGIPQTDVIDSFQDES